MSKKRTTEQGRAAVARYKAAHPGRIMENQRRYRASLSPEKLDARRAQGREREARRRREHPEYFKKLAPAARSRWIRRKYRMSDNDYRALLESQGGKCAICGTQPGKKHFDIDHNHACCPGGGSCGECVRGLLCGGCNKRLGVLEDSDFCAAADAYLSKRKLKRLA